MEAEFKPARLTDARAIVEMMKDFYDGEGIDPPGPRTRAALEKVITHPSIGRAWMITSAGMAAGYAILTLGFSLEFGGRTAFIDELYLKPEWRGKGLGRQAVEFLIERAHAMGVREILLEVDREKKRAGDLYRLAGFKDRTRLLLSQKL